MQYNIRASQKSIDKVVSSLRGKGYTTVIVEKKADALEKIKELIPAGASIMNGSSVSLEQIGYVDYLKQNTHVWVDLHAAVTNQQDPAKRAAIRKQAVNSDYYLGSVHALVEDGVFLIASNTGSQLPHISFTSPNLIFVVGTQKIVSTLDEAMTRLETYVVPLENDHMMKLYNMGTTLNKILIFRGDPQFLKRNIHFILVKDVVGF